MVFIYLEKAYDTIPRAVMLWTLEKHKVSTKYITLIRDMYDHVVTSVYVIVRLIHSNHDRTTSKVDLEPIHVSLGDG
jgi:hypothetical protein